MTLAELLQPLREAGARDCHEARLLREWLQARPVPEDAAERDFHPAAVRALLPAWRARRDALAALIAEHPAADGARLLLRLADGQTIESVLLPRGGVCVSTQVGCAVGCVFCMTGRSGLVRQLGAAEIVAQVAVARRQRRVSKVVFMGMGEPAHNLDAVCEAIELLGSLGGVGYKNLVFSTVGDPRVFERLPTLRAVPALAVSLHTTRPALRTELLPRAPRMSPDELVEAADAYARATGYPVQYQWTLMAGVNDGDDELAGLERLLAGRYAVLNFIPYNAVEGLPYARPDWARAAAMARHLHRRGILTKLRHSAAQEVDGGCGQLRARIALERSAA